ncbi:helicase [Sansalvadorimonas verongulae]|uniref:helicase n=1 Tax=Sansalvadorimonas verongulae TaxID=2172824 RepID=UPI001E4F0E4D|nr:helicase [Sansalvadorimonas verongulae]MTI13086.1 helicase [Sansalvadorimonas verongulae]
MKFRLLLLGLGLLMKRASANNPAFQKKLEGKDMSFEISSDDGVCRSFTVKNNTVSSRGGKAQAPEFCLRFQSAQEGFSALTAKNAQLAFMKGIQDKTIRVEGNPMSLMWFQSIAAMVVPRKKKKKQAA